MVDPFWLWVLGATGCQVALAWHINRPKRKLFCSAALPRSEGLVGRFTFPLPSPLGPAHHQTLPRLAKEAEEGVTGHYEDYALVMGPRIKRS
ncbi:uncharacterized protein B0T15DRAFT_539480 [Chaetomium strumarium]|uniref:Uncharacterized protein n=1 Tax=Chaetomium strumarium TaxID=1170767 RepID=A0AAJ0LZ89_9PEZI|nr:hypothetical protein B0T15DRAFT_539480 [Chaetomium strumarium]